MGEFAQIPAQLQSVESLELIGYDGPTARTIWQAWLTPTVYDKGTFIAFAINHIRRGCVNIADTTANNDSQWALVMSACGIKSDTQNRIMNPQHEDVRLTRSAKYWIMDTLEIRYGALKEVQGNVDFLAQPKCVTTSAGEIFEDHAANVTQIPGHLTLYHSQSKSTVTVLSSTRKIQLESLTDANPTDFSGNRVGDTIYFTPQYWVAEKYAEYLKHRQEIGTVLIIKMSIPNDWVQQAPKRIFTYGDDWKHVVLNSRRSCPPEDLPYGLCSIKSKAILIGPILKINTVGIEQMSDISQITEQNLMKHPSTREVGSQYAIRVYMMENLKDVAITEIVETLSEK